MSEISSVANKAIAGRGVRRGRGREYCGGVKCDAALLYFVSPRYDAALHVGYVDDEN